MSGQEKAEQIQRELFRNISLEVTDQELDEIKQELKLKAFGGFKAGEIQRELKTTDDILEKLKRKGLIKIGEYGILRKLAEAIRSQPLKDYIDQAENSLIAIHWPLKRPELDAPRGDPRPGPMDTYGGYPPQHPFQGRMAHPPPYQYDPHHGYPSSGFQHSSMGPPQHPVQPAAQPAASHQQYTSYQDSLMRPPAQPVPRASTSYPNSYQPMAQSTNPQCSPSVADGQSRAGSATSGQYEDGNISFDCRSEYEPGRGFVLFINNFFTGKSDHRRGAEVDEKNIRHLFANVLKGFHLQYEKDVSLTELEGYLKNLKDTLSTGRYKNFIFILGSHGEPKRDGADMRVKDAVLMADGKWMLIEDIVSNFHGDQIPAMKNKPKVFIIQSCRGKELQRSVSLSDSPATLSNPEPAVTTRPVNSDILIAYATSEGKKAWRNEDEGSWFVKDLCDVITEYHDKEHILDILVRVNSLMVWREATDNRGKQMPCFVCTFTRRFMLAYPDK